MSLHADDRPRHTLDAYLANPQKVVPGNHMPYSGMPDGAKRAAPVEYLALLH